MRMKIRTNELSLLAEELQSKLGGFVMKRFGFGCCSLCSLRCSCHGCVVFFQQQHNYFH